MSVPALEAPPFSMQPCSHRAQPCLLEYTVDVPPEPGMRGWVEGWGVASRNLNWIEPDHFGHLLLLHFLFLAANGLHLLPKNETCHDGGGGGVYTSLPSLIASAALFAFVVPHID